jgi:predicted small lipoprotein YifL
MPSVRSSFITFLGTLLLVGCGLKGPLYLPDDKAKDSKKETREADPAAETDREESAE